MTPVARMGLALLASVGVFGLAAAKAEAGQRHWFYGNYGYYEGKAWEERLYGLPPLPPVYEAPPPRRYHRPRRVYVPVPDEEVEYGALEAPYDDGPDFGAAPPPRRLAPPPGMPPLPPLPQRGASRQPAEQPAPPPRKRIPEGAFKNAPAAPKSAPVAPPPPAQTGAAPKTDAVKTAAVPKPKTKAAAIETPEAEPGATTGSIGKAITCTEGRDIVKGFGFSDVKAGNCSGSSFVFEATRDGKPFTVTLNAQNGELADVKKR